MIPALLYLAALFCFVLSCVEENDGLGTWFLGMCFWLMAHTLETDAAADAHHENRSYMNE